jgi:hypothetical protein
MKGWGVVVGVIVGVIAVAGAVAATGNGRDHAGRIVPTSSWANDVCGTVGDWEGQLEVIRDELRFSNFGARRSDGGSGDAVEGTVTVRSAVDRAIQATDETLQKGLERAGVPDLPSGAHAGAILGNWAQQTEANLDAAQAELRRKPATNSEAFAALLAPVGTIAQSAIAGRAALNQVGALDPQLAHAVAHEPNCRELAEERP